MSNIERKPKIRFPEFTDAWEHRKLKNFASFTTGNGLSRDDITDDGEQECILYGHLYTNYGMIADKVLFKTNATLKYPIHSEYGDVLIPASDTTPTGLARATSIEKSGVLLGGGINIVRPNKGINGSFLSLAINAKKKALLQLIKGTTVRHIYNSDIQNIDISLPKNLLEQDKVRNFFKSLDKNITLHQRKLEILKKLKKGFLQKLFPQKDNKVPELRFPGFSGDWEQCKLGDLGTTYSGLSGKKKEDFGHGEARFITFLNVMNNAISDPSMTGSVEIDNKQNKVKKGDVLFTVSSETPNDVGTSSVIVNDCENTYLNSFCFGYRPKTEFDLFYLAYMLRAPSFRNDVILLAQGISRYNISKNKVMEIKITIPSSEEQHKVGCAMKSIDNLITLHQRKLEILQNIKKGFLQQMFV